MNSIEYLIEREFIRLPSSYQKNFLNRIDASYVCKKNCKAKIRKKCKKNIFLTLACVNSIIKIFLVLNIVFIFNIILTILYFFRYKCRQDKCTAGQNPYLENSSLEIMNLLLISINEVLWEKERLILSVLLANF